jgi:hypothetical protein
VVKSIKGFGERWWSCIGGSRDTEMSFFLNLKLHVFFLNLSSFCWFIYLLDSIDGILWFLGCYCFWKLTRIVLWFLKQWHEFVNISGLPFIPWLDSLIGANMQALQSLNYGMKGGRKAVSEMNKVWLKTPYLLFSINTSS